MGFCTGAVDGTTSCLECERCERRRREKHGDGRITHHATDFSRSMSKVLQIFKAAMFRKRSRPRDGKGRLDPVRRHSSEFFSKSSDDIIITTQVTFASLHLPLHLTAYLE
jgi:hypothetical protein